MIFGDRTARAGAVLAAAALALSACSAGAAAPGSASSGGYPIVIGGPDSTEGAIMTQLYAGVLEDAGYDTEVAAVSNRGLSISQLSSGTIQVVPHYLGTLTEYLNIDANLEGAPAVTSSDTKKTLTEGQELAARYGIELLEPAKAQNQHAFAVAKDFATQNNLKSLSDLGALRQPVILAGPAQCPQRPSCVPGLEKTYGITIASTTPTGAGAAAAKQEVASGKAQLALVATTDATLGQFGLVALKDDKGLQQIENLVPVVSESVAGDTTLVGALNELSKTLSTADLARLNAQVDGQRQLPADVTQKYLQDTKLIDG